MSSLRIFLKQSPVSVLGPFERAVLWVQGCPMRCKGCISPYSLDPEGGVDVDVCELAAWVLDQTGIEGITVSGGEPMMQAGALAALIDAVRSSRDIGVVCYSGYVYEKLQTMPEALPLLSRSDLLIDGPYVGKMHRELLWRASSNQRLVCLTDRYREVVAESLASGDQSAGLEVFVSKEGQLVVAGVPVDPDIAQSLKEIR